MPPYKFTRMLKETYQEYLGSSSITLGCAVNDHRATTKWFKDGVEIEADDIKYSIDSDILGKIHLIIRNTVREDASAYSCQIVETGEVTKCTLSLIGKPY